MELSGVSDATSFTDQGTPIVNGNFDNSEMSQDDFLQVLLADIQWQNPLDANDISDFIGNTLKLREMEVLNSFEESVSALESANDSSALLQASGMIGKTVQYEGNSTIVSDGEGSAVFTLDANADQVTLRLYDSDGALVDSATYADLQGGVVYPFEISDTSFPDGYYKVSVTASLNGESVDATVQSHGVVEGVTRDNGSLAVYFGDEEVELDSITQIGA